MTDVKGLYSNFSQMSKLVFYRTYFWMCFVFPYRTVHYCMTNNKHFSFAANALPEQLRSQKQIVELMANYMEENLMEVNECFS